MMNPARRFAPTDLRKRTALIFLFPVVLILFVMTWYYYDFHIQQMNRSLTQHMGRTISLYLSDLNNRFEDEEKLNERMYQHLETTVSSPNSCSNSEYKTSPTDRSQIRRHLSGFIDYPFNWKQDTTMGTVSICVLPPDRSPIEFVIPRKRMIAINSHIFLVWVWLAGAVMTLVAYGFLRIQVRSILNLTEAAKAIGRGQEIADFKPSGATEIRDAARAVMDMKEQLTATTSQRTAMLAGVSHDLRTPLTRLKLAVSMQTDNDEKQAMLGDISDMQALLDEYLAFTREEDSEDVATFSGLVLLQEVAGAFNTDRISIRECADVDLTGKRGRIKRAITNLIDNALYYAEKVDLELQISGSEIDITVDDDGPGIDPSLLKEAMQPFSRLDSSRSQNKAGAGLGLAIASDVARSHGGRLNLENRSTGGLRVQLKIPT